MHVDRRVGGAVMVDARREAGPVWEEALRESGLAGTGKVHSGMVNRPAGAPVAVVFCFLVG